MATLISHFYNEEFLLPYWLRHHVRLFENGILIDYDSSDESVEIIRSVAPHWKVVPSRNIAFDSAAIDSEVMAIERSVPGWKMVLNTTEFLLIEDLESYLRSIPSAAIGVRADSYILVDPGEPISPPLTDDYLVLQRTYGYREEEVVHSRPFCTGYTMRQRLLHRAADGAYPPEGGRHRTAHDVAVDPRLVLAWFGWSPWPQVGERKLQIQYRMSRRDVLSGAGSYHIMSNNQMDEQHKQQLSLSRDLLGDEFYRERVDGIRRLWGNNA